MTNSCYRLPAIKALQVNIFDGDILARNVFAALDSHRLVHRRRPSNVAEVHIPELHARRRLKTKWLLVRFTPANASSRTSKGNQQLEGNSATHRSVAFLPGAELLVDHDRVANIANHEVLKD